MQALSESRPDQRLSFQPAQEESDGNGIEPPGSRGGGHENTEKRRRSARRCDRCAKPVERARKSRPTEADLQPEAALRQLPLILQPRCTTHGFDRSHCIKKRLL